MPNFSDSAGFSTIETAVALVLAVAVAAPSVAILLQLAETAYGSREIQALAIGQDAMENWIAGVDYTSGTLQLQDGRWSVRRTATLNGRQAVLTVEVFRRRRAKPYVTLHTARLQPVDSLRYSPSRRSVP